MIGGFACGVVLSQLINFIVVVGTQATEHQLLLALTDDFTVTDKVETEAHGAAFAINIQR